MGLDPLPVWRMVRTTQMEEVGLHLRRKRRCGLRSRHQVGGSPQSMDRTASQKNVGHQQRGASAIAELKRSRYSKTKPSKATFFKTVCLRVFSFLYVCTFRQEAVFSYFRRPNSSLEYARCM